MTLRPIQREECGRLADLHARCFPGGWSSLEIAQLATDKGVIAVCDDAISAFILVRCVADEAEILTLAVSPESRRCGSGRALVLAALESATDRGARTCFLEVSRSNTAAFQLYVSAGFHETGVRKAYYADGSDALVMEKTLGE